MIVSGCPSSLKSNRMSIMPRYRLRLALLVLCSIVITFSFRDKVEVPTTLEEDPVPVTMSVNDTALFIRNVSFRLSNLVNHTKSFIVNTPTCKIPELNLWHKSVELLPRHVDNKSCHESHSWMYSDAGYLVVNETAIMSSGFTLSTITCCFRVMERVTVAKMNSSIKYPKGTDSMVNYSSNCYPIKSPRMLIKSEFIQVTCQSKLTSSNSKNDAYRAHFAFANPDSKAQKKIEMWKTGRQTKELPPHVIILGIDTVSRLHGRRYLKKTLKLLQQIDAVELLGYTKVGENTFPNTVAFFTGLYLEEMRKLCHKHDVEPQDDCPYIWKEFDKAGYLTATAEDTTDELETGFNYRKLGFREKPTDFYLRPFIKTTMKDPLNNGSGKCIGSLSRSEAVFNYITDIVKRGSPGAGGAPIFLHTWLSSHSHTYQNQLVLLDEPITKFIKNVDLENAILFLASDHFVRYGKFRLTKMGWYEDKLPLLWVYLPKKVKRKFPEWSNSLKMNSKRLTSHFDLYQTLVHILESYSAPINHLKGNLMTKGNSLFHPIPENRTCSQAGIPMAFCPCKEYDQLDFANDVATQVVHFTLEYIQNEIPKECAQLSLRRIEEARIIHFENEIMDYLFIVRFVAEPGNFKFEASVQAIKNEEGKYEFQIDSLEDILRTNLILRRVHCVKDSVLERYCYCN